MSTRAQQPDRLAHLSDPLLYKEFYEAASRYNEQLYSLHPQEPRLTWTLEHLEPWMDVIDLGCHKFDMTWEIAVRTKGKVYGIDISEVALVEGRKRPHCENIVAICADVANVPLPDSMFDMAVLAEILEHVPDADVVLAEAQRLVKPNGLIVLSVPADAEGWDNNGDREEKYVLGYELDAHVREFKPHVLLRNKPMFRTRYAFQMMSKHGHELGHRMASYRVVK